LNAVFRLRISGPLSCAILAKLGACLLIPSSSTLQCQTAERAGTENAPEPHIRVESNLVLVRVVVRDAHGQPVKGLRKEDFKLSDRGKDQVVTQFEENSSDDPPLRQPNTVPAQATMAPSATERSIAFYFDDLNTSDSDLMRARDAADHLLAVSLHPHDRVAVFTEEEMLSDFTSDPAQINDALFRVRASVRSLARVHECPDLSAYQALEITQSNDTESDAWKAAWAEARTCALRSFASHQDSNALKPDNASMTAIRMLAQRTVSQSETLSSATLQQLDQVVKNLASMRGQRSVVLISPGFVSQGELLNVDRVIDRALRAGVVINSLDPRGLAILLREADASRSSGPLPDPHAAGASHNLDWEQETMGSEVLAELAQGTGGDFFHSSNDLTSGLATVIGHPPYYTLAFAPRNLKLDGKFHALKVSLVQKSKGYSIDARRGYFADANPPDNNVRASTLTVADTFVPGSAPKSTPSVIPPTGEAREISAASPNEKPIHPWNEVNRVTVEQLEQILGMAHGRPDSEVARQLSKLELTERLSNVKFAYLDGELSGNQAKQALRGRADLSSFLSLPSAELPSNAAPNVDAQSQWLKLAVNYVARSLSALPNLFATRDVTLFADTPPKQDGATYMPRQLLHFIERSTATVLYRDGKEVVDTRDAKKSRFEPAPMGLVTSGEFGPILGTVLADAARSSLTWGRWENGANGPVAVYRFAVPRENSHYQVRFCCVPEGDGMTVYRQLSAYHGEITVDPATGAILRLTIQANLKPAHPMERADILVEYGPIEIGGKTYICPVRSVAIADANVQPAADVPEHPHFRGMLSEESNQNALPTQMLLNDISFDQYHVFRSDSRILPAGSPASQEK
jgi:VWFA-related protein